jgi:predicted acyltransferase
MSNRTEVSAPAGAVAAPAGRLASLDAYRGAIMFYMASHSFGITDVAQKFPGSFWQTLAWWFDHVAWVGCSTWDLIQPAFMFMVGVAVPYSYASRAAQGHSFGKQLRHALVRAVILILLAVFVSSGPTRTNWVFTNVLAQIGLGYPFLLFLLNRRFTVQAGTAAAILAACWLFFALHPLPAAGFDYASVGVTPKLMAAGAVPGGFFAHWAMNTNAAAAFDAWFLNLFPRAEPFVFNKGGYATLNFVPSLATMIFGLMCGELLRSPRTPREKIRALLIAGLALVAAGAIAGFTVCPIVKRIWTPSWALFSGGIVVSLLAAFYWVIDVAGCKKWAHFLLIVGMNSIAIYLMSQLMRPWVGDVLKIHLGADRFTGNYGAIWKQSLTLLFFWLVCWWMYRRKIFLKI